MIEDLFAADRKKLAAGRLTILGGFAAVTGAPALRFSKGVFEA